MSIDNFYSSCIHDGRVSLAALSMGSDAAIKDVRFGAFSVTLLQESLSAFRQGELTRFDAQVGETSCQIRAIKIAALFNKSMNMQNEISSLLTRSAVAKEKLAQLCTPSSTKKEKQLKKSTFNLKTFAQEHRLDMEEDLFFALLSYALTIVKQRDDDGALSVCRKQLQKEPYNLTKNASQSFINHAQRLLSQLSVRYVQELAKAHDAFVQTVCADTREDVQLKRRCTPCFHAMRVLLDHASAEGIPLLVQLSIGEERVFLHDVEGSLELCAKEGLRGRAAIIFAGPTGMRGAHLLDVAQRVIQGMQAQGGLREVLLMEAAAHPQYASEHKGELPSHPQAQQEIAAYATRAREVGCCWENQMLFFPKHIFAQYVKKEVM